jgi:hypothetical protein
MAERLCLVAARKLAERTRFSGDTLRQRTEGDASHTENIRNLFFENALQITDSVTPSLSKCMENVCTRLQIPKGSVEAFVYPFSEIQAECFAGSTSDCVIRFSSSLIELIDEEEFEFVAGHELGHFLLGHGVAKMENEKTSLEYFMQQRAQEISVDRIGLLACESMDIAIRALMKTASGLTSKHLRFDVGTFISQLRRSSDTPVQGSLTASHPTMLVRCRALLWFSLNDVFTKADRNVSESQMRKLDKMIENDLYKYVDGPVRKRIEEVKQNLAMWMAASEVVQNGVFEKKEQENFEENFGAATLMKLKNFLMEIPVSEAQEAVFERMRAAREDLEDIIPGSFEEEFKNIEERVLSKFNSQFQ